MAKGAALKIHDRRSNDTLEAGQYASLEVDDPYEAGEKIVVLRQLRCDPLARLHSHHQIDDAQYTAGRCYQRDWELAERGARAIDPTKEAVDGGLMPEPITDGQQRSRKRLIYLRSVLGKTMLNVIHGFLIEGKTIEQISSKSFNRESARWANYYGRMVRDALELLAAEYNLRTK